MASIMIIKLEKIYDPTNEEDDMVEMEEERLRMREHVMNEVKDDYNNGPILFLWQLEEDRQIFSKSLIFWPLQVDTNKDRLVSLDEFLVATKKKEFLEPDSWEVSIVLSMVTDI